MILSLAVMARAGSASPEAGDSPRPDSVHPSFIDSSGGTPRARAIPVGSSP